MESKYKNEINMIIKLNLMKLLNYKKIFHIIINNSNYKQNNLNERDNFF